MTERKAVKRLIKYMRDKNKLGKKLFGAPFCTKKELKKLIKDLLKGNTDIDAHTTISLLSAEKGPGDMCPHCIAYVNCSGCPLRIRTLECSMHPVLKKVKIWSRVRTKLKQNGIAKLVKKAHHG